MDNQYQHIKKVLDEKGVQLVAVSKTFSAADILAVYDEGQRIFGENKVQELREKQPKLPNEIEWHFIGSLQRNKVKYIASYIGLIHSLDSLSLAKEISKRAVENDRVIDALIQVKVAEERSKQGIEKSDLDEFIEDLFAEPLPGLRLRGIMGMGTFTDDELKTKSEFDEIKRMFDYLQSKYFRDNAAFDTISMGMSSDYEQAIESGSTMVRIGSLIFGDRRK